MYPGATIDVPLDTVDGACAAMLASLAAVNADWATEAAVPASALSYDIAAAAQRQAAFFYQVSLPHYQDTDFLKTALERCAATLTSFVAVVSCAFSPCSWCLLCKLPGVAGYPSKSRSFLTTKACGRNTGNFFTHSSKLMVQCRASRVPK